MRNLAAINQLVIETLTEGMSQEAITMMFGVSDLTQDALKKSDIFGLTEMEIPRELIELMITAQVQKFKAMEENMGKTMALATPFYVSILGQEAANKLQSEMLKLCKTMFENVKKLNVDRLMQSGERRGLRLIVN